jgi:endonuclease/exonuclease/phosphatase (EEP) superfamily protein YafD
LILGVTALAGALLRRFLVTGAAVALALTNLVVFAPVWDETGPPETGALELTVLVLNLDARNDDHEAVAELIRERRPDVFGAVELTTVWERELDEVLEPYGYRHLEAREALWGVGIYSRRPLSDPTTLFPGGADYPLAVATVEGRSRPIRLALLHPRAPATPSEADRHASLLRAAGEAVRAGGGSGIVMGDLNTTPWSARYRELLEDAGLEDTREGRGLQTTWPSFLPTILRIPIDHVLVTPDLAAAEREVGPEVGSDHLPVWAELALRVG